jgi:LacI family transcriptional regulator
MSRPDNNRAGLVATITISDVADMAGVSIKTVSRVLNREPNVADATRAKVEHAVKALNYRPNISARSLAGSKFYLIGLLFDNPSPDYVINLQFGAMKKCKEEGYHLIIDALNSTSEDFGFEVESMIADVRTDGYILPPPLSDDDRLLSVLEAMNIPYVRIAPYRDAGRGPHVSMDDAGAAFELTSLLLRLGHRDIGFIAGHPDHGATHLRYGGYSAALRSQGVPLLRKRVKQGDFTARSGIERAEELLSDADRPTAIFASNDEMALGVHLVANRLGLKVPDDLSICGFDDMPAAKLVWPQLTTVRQPIAEMSAAAVELLVKKQTGDVGLLLDFELVERGSTGPAPKKP